MQQAASQGEHGTHADPVHETIRFVLDGEIVTISACDPTRTVLQYLREDRQRTGTKEGCAEGDCGACTVVTAELDSSGNTLRYRAINSCIQFLPTLDGKELLTVESLVGKDGTLHPVQQAMVTEHGSQCGFCTPGFVMSLFALYKQQAAASRQQIDDALAGNLCRCTGYRPIVDAAMTMYALGNQLPKQQCNRLTRPARATATSSTQGTPVPTPDDAADERATVTLLRSLVRQRTLQVSDGHKTFFAPVTLDDFATLVEQHPDACLLAGGTDVGLWVTRQFRTLSTVIYAARVPELKRLTVDDEAIHIGAALSISDAMPVLIEHYPDVAEMLVRFGSPPIRNAGTLGGNVANGSPIGDALPALIAMGTRVVLRKGTDSRELALDEFYLDYQKTALGRGEFVATLRVPRPPAGQVFRCYKVSKRFDQDISAVCGAFALSLKDNLVDSLRVAYGGMAAIPKRAIACEDFLRGKLWNEASLEGGMAALSEDFKPLSDMRASAGYRQRVCANLLYRFFLESSGTAQLTRVYGYDR